MQLVDEQLGCSPQNNLLEPPRGPSFCIHVLSIILVEEIFRYISYLIKLYQIQNDVHQYCNKTNLLTHVPEMSSGVGGLERINADIH